MIDLLYVDIDATRRKEIESLLQATAKRRDRNYISFSDHANALEYLRKHSYLPRIEVVTLTELGDLSFGHAMDMYRDYERRRWAERCFCLIYTTPEQVKEARKVVGETDVVKFIEASDRLKLFRYIGLENQLNLRQ